MSPHVALFEPAGHVFRVYLVLVVVVLAVAGAVLVAMQLGLKRNVSSIWQTYRGWLIMVPLVVGFVFLGRAATIVGVTLLSIFGFKEFARATGLYDDWWMTGAAYVAIAFVGVASLVPDPYTHVHGWWGMFMAMPAFAINFLFVIPILRNRTQGQLQEIALAIFGFLYFGWMFGHVGYLADGAYAYGFLLYIVVATELNDVAAFTSGKLFGHRQLRSNISPKKTWGGALGAVAVSLVLPWLLRFSFPPQFGPRQLVLTGLIVGIGGQLGDLCISVIKRDLGIKDMGAAIPGHGGILDRIDSLIFVAPVFLHMVEYYKMLR